MKFACPNCDSKYTIADERVRNKVLKIRCKSCNNVIEVRESTAKSGDGGGKGSKKGLSALEDRFADSFRKDKKGSSKLKKGTPGLYMSVKRSAEVLQKADTEFVHWFVAIDSSPFGPVSARKIHSHKKSGKVDDASLIWKEGMADWIPIRDCKELTGLLSRIDKEGGQEAGEESKGEKKLGLFAEDGKSAKSPLKGGDVGVIGKREDAVTPDESAVAGQASGGDVGVIGKREDAVTPDESAVAGQASGGETPMPASKDGAEDAFFSKEEAADKDLPDRDSLIDHQVSNLAPLKTSGSTQNRWVMMAAVGFLIVAMVTLGVAILGGADTGETITSVETVEKIVERVVYMDRPVQRIEGESTVEVEEGEPQANTRTGAKPKGSRVKKSSAADAKTKALMEQMGLSTPGGAVPVGGGSKKHSSSSSSSGAGSLTANQVKRVVDKNKGRLKACYERALKTGDAPDDTSVRVDFKLNVGSSGIVKSTQLGGAGARIGPLKQCLTRSVSKWVFPPSGTASPVEFPFVFTPK